MISVYCYLASYLRPSFSSSALTLWKEHDMPWEPWTVHVITEPPALLSGLAHTNAISLSSKTHRAIDSRPPYRFDAFPSVHTKTFENDSIARCDVSWTACACYKHMRLQYFRLSFSFWCIFDRPYEYDMYAFLFWSTFKNVFKSMRFPCKRSAY